MNKMNIVPVVTGVGGMVSFQRRFIRGIQKLGIEVVQGFDTSGSKAMLVIGGTSHIIDLWNAKQQGIRIVQRLNGMNWLHRKLSTGFNHYLRSEYGNLILRFIRSFIADHVVYQSNFAKGWWEKEFGNLEHPSTVIYNAVDLSCYSPLAEKNDFMEQSGSESDCHRPEDYFRIMIVEGSMTGGYEIGLEVATQLASGLNQNHVDTLNKPVELVVVGNISQELISEWEGKISYPIIFVGQIGASLIPCLMNSAHLLFSADINPACPNAAIEALACGTPVLGFDTGALDEIISDESGIVVPYGSDPWRLETPNLRGLADGAVEILLNQESYRQGARQRAEEKFSLDCMVRAYLDVLFQRE